MSRSILVAGSWNLKAWCNSLTSCPGACWWLITDLGWCNSLSSCPGALWNDYALPTHTWMLVCWGYGSPLQRWIKRASIVWLLQTRAFAVRSAIVIACASIEVIWFFLFICFVEVSKDNNAIGRWNFELTDQNYWHRQIAGGEQEKLVKDLEAVFFPLSVATDCAILG